MQPGWFMGDGQVGRTRMDRCLGSVGFLENALCFRTFARHAAEWSHDGVTKQQGLAARPALSPCVETFLECLDLHMKLQRASLVEIVSIQLR